MDDGSTRILIAEDDPVSRRLLQVTLDRAGYDVLSTEDGGEAWQVMQGEQPPRLMVLDWMMPSLDGVEVCRRVRAARELPYVYILMLTAKTEQTDIVSGLEAGADDYLTKPYHPSELRARVRSGERILTLEADLAGKVRELEEALAEVKTLQGLLPICMFCKKIRDDQAVWHDIESYIEHRSDALFSHSLCVECQKEHYPEVPPRPS